MGRVCYSIDHDDNVTGYISQCTSKSDLDNNTKRTELSVKRNQPGVCFACFHALRPEPEATQINRNESLVCTTSWQRGARWRAEGLCGCFLLCH